MGSERNHKSSFFKIMFGNFADNLRIPLDFVKHFNARILPKTLNLEISTRVHWVVNLKKVDNDLFLEQGWRDFVVDNSIGVGDVLVFKLVANSTFEVAIYGNNCCEKEIPIHNQNTRNCTCYNREGRRRKAKQKCSKCMSLEESIPSGGSNALDEDHYFTATFRQDTQQKLPTEFINKLGDKLSNKVFVKTPGGEHYEVQLQKVKDNIFLQNGWERFVKEQSIRDGQLLVFKYSGNSSFNVVKVDMTDKAAKSGDEKGNTVIIIDDEMVGEHENVSTQSHNKKPMRNKVLGTRISKPVTSKQRREFKAASGFKSRYPSFIVRLAPHYGRDRVLRIPSSFVEAQLPEKSMNAKILVGKGKTWLVKYKYYSNYRGYISKGWTEFVAENKLREGDVYAFELIEKKKDIKLKLTSLSR